MERKNIIYVEQSQVGTVGGSHTCLYELLRGVDRSKYRTIVVLYERSYFVDELRKVADRVIVYSKPRKLDVLKFFSAMNPILSVIVYYPALFFQKICNFILCLVPLATYLKILNKYDVDLVHLNNSFYLSYDWVVVSRIRRKKCITHQRGVGTIPRTGRILIRLYDAVICVSESIQTELRNQGISLNRRIFTLYDGVNLTEIQRQVTHTSLEIRKLFGIGRKEILIGMVGNIKHWKGQEVVVDAICLLVRKYSNLKCLFVGEAAPEDSHYLQRLKSKISELQVSHHIIFTGFRKDICNFINAADILVHASIEPEPFGRILLEGMALGKPVIATNIGGPSEIIEHGISGYLVPPNDPGALTKAIDVLLTNSSLRERIGNAAKVRVSRVFPMEQTVREIHKLYTQLLEENHQ